MQKKNFATFIELWNIHQGFRTPLIHTRMARWLESSWKRGENRLLLMAFRASGKSTIVGLFAAWLLYQDQDLRILVLAADASLSRKMVRDVRKIIENHPLTPHLLPPKIDQWASNRFTILRHKKLRDPSMLAMGISANITGSRADVIIYDDVEVPNNSNNASKRETLRVWLRESNFILVPDGTQLYVGTPHSYFSIYADKPRHEVDEKNIFLEGFKRFFLPILNAKNISVWPEKFSQKVIDLLLKQTGPAKFASQMMLQPVNIVESRLDVSLLQYYPDDLVYAEANKQTQLTIAGKKMVSCSAWWDPAFGSAKGDSSVVAIVYTDAQGRHYLHHIHYINVDLKEGDDDEATLQCQIIANLMVRFYVPALTIETNGIGKFLPAILRRELALKNIACAVMEYSNHRPKQIRILESFDALMAAKSLYIHDDIRKTPFVREMMEWQPSAKNNNDDGLDAVAGALSQEPVRIKRHYAMKQSKISPFARTHQADTNFDI